MRSEFAEKFNHDEDAPTYDQDVRQEAHPIRAGYNMLLDWVAAQVPQGPHTTVVDLGVGTGNLAARIGEWGNLLCVDVSAKMWALAQSKLQDNAHFVQEDILAFFDQSRGPFDAIVSTYTIHHLTSHEKTLFFQHLFASLKPGGVAAFGDLMFAHDQAKASILAHYCATGRQSLAEDIEDEFFWDVQTTERQLRRLGMIVEVKRFSTLSWGITARRPKAT